jgi:hypothetical protein
VTGDDVVFLLVVLVPLFAARWRVSLLGIGLQGALLLRASHGSALDVADFAVLRGLVAPLLLYRVQTRSGGSHRNDVIPANLFAWVVVVVLTTAAFRFADAIEPGGAGHGRVAVATAALVLGMFVLASQNSVFSQIMAILRIENAVALFELALPHAPDDPGLRIAQIAITGGVVGLVAWYLRALHGFTAEEVTE